MGEQRSDGLVKASVTSGPSSGGGVAARILHTRMTQ